MTTDQNFQHTMVAPGQAMRRQVGSGAGGGEEEEKAEGCIGEKDPEPDRDLAMAEDEIGEGVHPQGRFEKVGADPRSGYPLIPKEGEASPLIQMPKGPAGNPGLYGGAVEAGTEPIQKNLGARVSQRARGAQERHPIMAHPRAHPLPMMKVGGQKQGGTGFEFFEFSVVPGSHADRFSISALHHSQKVQRDMEAKPQARKARMNPAPKRIFAENGPFPPSYIKEQGEGRRERV